MKMKKTKPRKDLSATRQMLEGFKKRRERKETERIENAQKEFAEKFGETPNWSEILVPSGDDIQGPKHDWQGRTPEGKILPMETETNRQQLLFRDEHPRLTKEDKLEIEKEIGATETYKNLDVEGMTEGWRTYQNKDFIDPANKMMEEKAKKAVEEKLAKGYPMYDASQDRGSSYNKYWQQQDTKYGGGSRVGRFESDPDANPWLVKRRPGEDPDDPSSWADNNWE
jgi:hypothetical protein